MSKKSKFQKFETEIINRSEIKGAEYNPRIISKDAKLRLRSMLAKHGLVQPLVWNKRTGNLVAGHQRLAALDELEKSADYALEVAIVDVSEREEKILNVQLNNPSMQGEWDLDKLVVLSHEAEINPDEFGFTDGDISVLFGDSDLSKTFEDTEDVANAKDKIREIKEIRSKGKDAMQERGNANFYFTVVCENEKQKKSILKYFGVPEYEQWLGGNKLASKLGI